MKKTIAITGSTGYLGNVVIRKLLQQGYNVRALLHINHNQSLEKLDFTRINGNVCDIESLRNLCEGCDALFHMASYISIVSYEDRKLFDTNIQGTRNVIQVCKEKQMRLIYCSSIEAIGKQGLHIHNENDGFNPEATLIRYGWSKAIATLEVLEAEKNDLDVVILCPAGIVGPYEFGTSKIGIMIKDFITHKLPAYPINGGFCFVDVRDVADAMIAGYTLGKSGLHYIVTSEYLDIEYWMGLLEELSGVRKPRIRISLKFMAFLAAIIEPSSKIFKTNPIFTSGSVRVLRSKLQVESIRLGKDLNIHPRPLRETFIDQIKWYRSEEVAL